MTQTKTTPITLITGYLGSGKTTLINHILKNAKGYKLAVIVNDIGEVNIDADLIEQGGVVSSKDDNLVPLSNGCICCTLKADLVNQLNQLCETHKYDHILIEASGICEPVPIAQTISYMENQYKAQHLVPLYRLDAIVSVTDAMRLKDEFGCGETLVRVARGEENIENLIIQQIEFCDIILLNKASLLSKEELRKVETVVKAIQPSAEIIRCDFCDVDLDSIIDTYLFDFDKAATSAAWIREFEDWDSDVEKHDEDEEEEHHHDHDDEDDDDHDHDHEHEEHHHHHHHHHEGIDNEEGGTALEYDINTFVYYRRRGFDRTKFKEWVTRNSHKIIRSKGLLYFNDNPDYSVIYESAGIQITLTNQGMWFSLGLSDKEVEDLLNNNVEFAHDWDPQYRDRLVKLVFIGQNLDEKAIRKELDAI
ncbi:MAG: GTP-binding protein [Bacilli bacterium]|nr:GTP-binding protein [Bacilli bacterium]